jgi:hypothetical protein
MPLILHEPQRRPAFLAYPLFRMLEVCPNSEKLLLMQRNQASFKRYRAILCSINHPFQSNPSHPTLLLLSTAQIEYP